MNLGYRFQKFRRRVGLSQKEAAEKIGINNYQLGNYETNRSEPSIAILKKMAALYGVSIDNLVGFNNRTKNAMELDSGPKIDVDELKALLDEIAKKSK